VVVVLAAGGTLVVATGAQRAEPVLLGRRPDAERFLATPDKAVRAALIFGRDLGVVRERAQGLAMAGKLSMASLTRTWTLFAYDSR